MYKITGITEKHIPALLNSLDFYSRIQCGQFQEIATRLNYLLFGDNDYDVKMREVERLLDEIKRIIFNYPPQRSTSISACKNENAKVAYEIFYLLRHFLAKEKGADNVYKHDLLSITDTSKVKISKHEPTTHEPTTRKTST